MSNIKYTWKFNNRYNTKYLSGVSVKNHNVTYGSQAPLEAPPPPTIPTWTPDINCLFITPAIFTAGGDKIIQLIQSCLSNLSTNENVYPNEINNSSLPHTVVFLPSTKPYNFNGATLSIGWFSTLVGAGSTNSIIFENDCITPTDI